MSGEQKKEHLTSMERKVFRKSPDDAKLSKAICVENAESAPIPVADVHSKNINILNPVIGAGEDNTEKSIALSDNIRRLIIRVKQKIDTNLKIAFISGATDSGSFWTIDRGGALDLDKINFTAKTLYYQGDKDNRTLEIIELF